MQHIKDSVWVLNLGAVNVGILELPSGGLALIDTDLPSSSQKTWSLGMASRFLTMRPKISCPSWAFLITSHPAPFAVFLAQSEYGF